MENFHEFLFTLRQSGFMHHTPEKERQLFHMLKKNSDKELMLHFFSRLDGEPGVLSKDSVQNAHNMIVGMNFLLCRIAIENHVDSEYAFTVSDYYINQTDHLTTLEEYQKLSDQMMLHYSQIIASNRPLSYTLPINRCILYIKRHLYQKITVQEIADYLNLTPSYLSALFHRETGTKLTDYIQQQKVEEAKIMIQYTANSLTTIASALGYSSLSHFSNVFHKYTGMSPKKYNNEVNTL